jgi:pimeloyl-ACP methyl ester carboxylesterase
MPEPLLLLPGLLCDARLWRDQVVALAGRAESVVADLTGDDSIDAMARRVLATAPERFSLCGLSMGGYVALAILGQAPGRVRRLCLMDTSARPDAPEQARRRRALIALAASHRFRGVTSHLLPRLVHPDRLADDAITTAVTGMAERVGRDAFLRQERAILHRPDARPLLGGIGVPTLVAVGSHDALTPLPLAEEMAESIPGAVLRVIPDAGHLPPLETPDAVNELLRAWLDNAL